MPIFFKLITIKPLYQHFQKNPLKVKLIKQIYYQPSVHSNPFCNQVSLCNILLKL